MIFASALLGRVLVGDWGEGGGGGGGHGCINNNVDLSLIHI